MFVRQWLNKIAIYVSKRRLGVTACSLGLLFGCIEGMGLWYGRSSLTRLLQGKAQLLNSVEHSVIAHCLVIVLCIHFGFCLIHYGFLKIFRPAIWIYCLGFLAYTFAYSLVYYPQLLEDFQPLKAVLPGLEFLRHEALVFGCGAAFVAILGASLLRRALPRRRLIGGLIVLLALSIFIFYFNDPYRRRNLKIYQSSHVRQKPNILLFGVDGLRPEIFAEVLAEGRHPSLSRFMSESARHSRAFSPVGRTHPALMSLLQGKPSRDLAIRGSNMQASLDTTAMYQGSWLERLKQEGYFNILSLDNTAFSYHFVGPLVDEVLTPQQGYYNVLLPFYLRDRLLFAWLNNKIGRVILPEVIGNSAFSDTSWPADYLETVVNSLDRVSRREGPTFALYHTVRLHWPGSTQYPYVKPRVQLPGGASLYNYSQLAGYLRINTDNTLSYAERSRQIYRVGVRQLLDQYLEPLFAKLYESGLMDQSTVALYSDHGEDFFTKGLLPAHREPQHGSVVAFGGESNAIVLAIRGKNLAAGEERAIFPLYGLLPKIFGQKLNRGEPYVMESDRWYESLFPGDTDFLVRIFQYLYIGKHEIAVHEPASEIKVMWRKERAVIDENQRTTLIPSVYGSYVLHDQWQNAVNPEPTAYQGVPAGIDEILRAYAADQERGWVGPFAKVYKLSPGVQLLTMDPVETMRRFMKFPRRSLIRYLQSGLEQMHLYLSPKGAESIFLRIANHQLVLKEFRDVARMLANKACAGLVETDSEAGRAIGLNEKALFGRNYSTLAFWQEACSGQGRLIASPADRLTRSARITILPSHTAPEARKLVLEIEDPFRVGHFLNEVGPNWKPNPKSDFEVMTYLTVSVTGADASVPSIVKDITALQERAKNSGAWGHFGLLDSWYRLLFEKFSLEQKQNDETRAKMRATMSAIVLRDPYLSLEMLQLIQHFSDELFTNLDERNKWNEFLRDFWAMPGSVLKRNLFRRTWASTFVPSEAVGLDSASDFPSQDLRRGE